VNIRLFFLMLKARYQLIVFTLAVTVATAVILAEVLPKTYTATAALVLDTADRNPLDTATIAASGKSSSTTYLATQLDIIQSRTVAMKVIDALKLDEKPDYVQAFQDNENGQGSIREWLIDNVLLKNLDVEPTRDSQVVSISYKAGSAKAAADTANAFAKAYIDTSLELITEPARRNAEWFDNQLKTMRQRLLDAQARLTQYQREKGITSIDERLDSETNRLNQLVQTLVQVQAAADEVKTRQLGENHPDYRAAVARERATRAAVENQKSLIMELKRQRDQLAVLSQDVDNAQHIYDTALQGYYQTSLQSKFNQPNIAVLTVAVPPNEDQASPNMLFSLISGICLGLVLGLTFAIMAEMLDRRIRTRDDVTEVLGTRVLATI
jgi:succinoglycan biosynthesis transport protein ExoP